MVLRPTRNKTDHFVDVSLGQSLGLVGNKLNLTQQKHGQTDGRTDGRTPYRYVDPARHTVRAASISFAAVADGCLGSRVVSVLDSGAEGPGFKSCNSLRQTVHTHRASVYQAAKLAAALLRVARVTAGMAESNGSLQPGL